jgi:hypothetical protein
MRKFYKNRSAVVSKLTGVGSPLRLNRFSRIQFPIYVGIGTQTTFMQKTILPASTPHVSYMRRPYREELCAAFRRSSR